jgi:hypothetical protein
MRPIESYDPLLERIEAEIAAREAAAIGRDDDEALRLEGSLSAFVEAAWRSVDAAPFMANWAVDGLCEHLQAVSDGYIKRLLVNFPPRCSKTLVTSICYPAWTFAQRERSYLKGPQVKFICGSYAHTLSLMNSNLCRRLILSPWYQELWGHQVVLRDDQNNKYHYDTTAGGSRVSTSVGGSLLGLGGDVVIADDPHDVAGIESEADRETVWRWFSELSSTRLNNPKEAAVIVVMQRLSAEDVTGRILDSDSSGDWRHYCVPMEWEAARCCQTGWQTDVGPVSWTDPRGLDDEGEPLLIFPDRMPRDDAAEAILQEREGALMWPERFGAEEIARLKASLGPFMSSGRLQQSPQPRGGELFRSAWWCVWESRDNKFPHVDFVVAAVDGAYTEDKLNDPSAMSVWGTFRRPELRAKRIICLDAWRKHVPIHGNATPRTAQETLLPGDTWQEVEMKNALYKQRAGREWGLVEWIRATCQRFSVDVLLIEKAATGISVAQEIQRLYFNDGIPVHLIPPRGD